MEQEKNKLPAGAERNERAEPFTRSDAGFSPLPSAETSKRWNRKRWIIGLALVFFLFSVIFIIPVSHIPVLRNLAWMMGFSAQDTQSMSFGRALLTWAGDGERRARPGSWSGNADASLSLFDRNRQQGFNAAGPQSGLFDLGAVNASLRARGLRPDGLYGAYAGEEDDRAAMNRRVNGWSAQARREAEEKDKAEVYFGEDASVAARAAEAANARTRGSSDTVGLLPKAGVVGSIPTDWLGQAIDKASLLNLGNLDDALKDKGTSGNTPLSNIGGALKAGDRPQRDLATVWLMSGAANKAPQLMLKKQLASAGYMAMEMPKKVFDSSGEGSGVRLAGDEMVASFEDANKQLLNEEQCRELGKQANSNVGPKLEESRNLIRQIRGGVPKNCGGITAWKGSLQAVQSNCKEVKDTFTNMKTACGVKLKKEGRCSTENLDSFAGEMTEVCAQMQDPQLTPEEKEALQKQFDDLSKSANTEVKDSFNINVDGISGGNDFFPETEENTSWIAGK